MEPNQGLQPGDRVRVVFNSDGSTRNQVMVAKFMSQFEDDFVFDLRPQAGTQYLSRRNIREIWLLHKSTPIQLPKTHYPETRVF